MPSENQYLQLLKLIHTQPELSQRELAGKMGISLGKVNYCLRALIAKGLIKLDNFQQARSKRKYVYLLTPAGVQEKARITINFLRSKEAEFEQLRREIECLRCELDEVGVSAVTGEGLSLS